MEIQYRTNTHSTTGCKHNTGLTTSVHNLLTQPPIYWLYMKLIQYRTKMHITWYIQYSYIIYNAQCWTYTTLTEYNTAQKYKIIYTIHNTYTVNIIQQTKNTIQHKTYAGLNTLAVVQTLPTTYMAQCTGSSTNKNAWLATHNTWGYNVLPTHSTCCPTE